MFHRSFHRIFHAVFTQLLVFASSPRSEIVDSTCMLRTVARSFIRSTMSGAGKKSALTLPIYQLDAFASKPFSGNPAAVVPFESWPDDSLLAKIAAENNLSETAYIMPVADSDSCNYHLRWFTPTVEVDLCGHATLATAGLILNRLKPTENTVRFQTRSGELIVSRDAASGGDRLTLDFPSWPNEPGKVTAPAPLMAAMGAETVAPLECYAIPPLHGAPYFLFVYESEAAVRALAPDFGAMKANVLATAEAAGDGIDFVSRFFGPPIGIDEDPVTGSAHTTLAPFWAGRLGKTRMEALQLSARGGELSVELNDATNRVFISGSTAFYMEGTIYVPQ